MKTPNDKTPYLNNRISNSKTEISISTKQNGQENKKHELAGNDIINTSRAQDGKKSNFKS